MEVPAPFTPDELLVHTLAPHDGVTTVIGNDGTCLLSMSVDGKLMKLNAPEGINLNDLSDEEMDKFVTDNFTEI